MSEKVRILETLVERECFYLRQKIEPFLAGGGEVVLFPAGLTSRQFYHTLTDDYGIEPEYFIDNNPALHGVVFCGKHVKSFEEVKNELKGKLVIVPTMYRYYAQIAKQLAGTGCVFIAGGVFCACQLWPRYEATLNTLGDELSRCSYLAALYDVLTFDHTFINHNSNQYSGVNEFVSLEDEIIADVGAYNGDTTEEFIKRSLARMKIYAFEPSASLLPKLRERLDRLNREWLLAEDSVIIVPAAAAAKTGTIRFWALSNGMMKDAAGAAQETPCYALDDYFKDKQPPTFIKADIEGGELDMLKGSQEIIRAHKPKLAICIYHSPAEFASIPEYIRSVVPEYNFAVRNHSGFYEDTVLYCWV